MTLHRRQPIEPALITIPSSDGAFREHVDKLERTTAPAELEARLRSIFPRVVVRERTLSGEAPAWYVYRDGSWRSPFLGSWWDDARLPCVDVSSDGWVREANATAMGLLGIEADEVATHHFTDFVVPGTLEDSIALFKIIQEGKPLDATVLLRPTSGDVIAIDLHAYREDDHLVTSSGSPTTSTWASPLRRRVDRPGSIATRRSTSHFEATCSAPWRGCPSRPRRVLRSGFDASIPTPPSGPTAIGGSPVANATRRLIRARHGGRREACHSSATTPRRSSSRQTRKRRRSSVARWSATTGRSS